MRKHTAAALWAGLCSIRSAGRIRRSGRRDVRRRLRLRLQILSDGHLSAQAKKYCRIGE
jgi:hypothetical protein